MQTIKTNLKQIRTSRKLKQEDLAIAIGTCKETISLIELGKRKPSLEVALRMASYFNLMVEDIFVLDET